MKKNTRRKRTGYPKPKYEIGDAASHGIFDRNGNQLEILRQGADTWNDWRDENPDVIINLAEFILQGVDLSGVNLGMMDHRHYRYIKRERRVHSSDEIRTPSQSKRDVHPVAIATIMVNLREVDLSKSNLQQASFIGADLGVAYLRDANLEEADFFRADVRNADLRGANLHKALLDDANLSNANFQSSNFSGATIGNTIFGNLDLSQVLGLEKVIHTSPSTIGTDTIAKSEGKIPIAFLQGCGLSDWEIESAKLYNPNLSNDELVNIQNKIFDLRNRQEIQTSSLFISYSHTDSQFVDKIEKYINKKGIRFWRDIHDAKSGRLEKQVDRAMRLNPTVLLILSKHSLQSDWVEHEVRTARALEKEMKRDTLCPVALDDSWKNSPWAKRIMEQIMEYNILDFSEWKDDAKFESTFNKLIDGLELFYK